MKITTKVDPISYVERWKMQKEAEKAQKAAEITDNTSPEAETEISKEVKKNGKKRKAES